ncbi:MAG TPA: DUF5050 domain-containing protein, partial [Candidatus Moranbacteria bacterium]|nr:DUF5050 domain-containing protein [Candidatus Moranbacteria bacterium]
TKKAFDSGISGILEEYGLVSTGNTSSNMLNGAFAIHYRDGKLYVHDGSGIYIHSAGHIVNEPVDCMFIGENVIYYIKSSDKKLYSKALPAGAEKLLCQTAASGIVVSGGKIYFKGLDDSQIYSVPREGGTPEMVSDGAAAYGLPVSAGNQIIYASKDSIISYSTPYKTTSVLYSGDVSDLCFDNSILYFKNGEGKLCFIDISGKNYTEITKMAVKTFCVFQGKIAFTAEDGLYKTNKNGSFCIRIDDVIYDALNSYNDYIYAKTADGSIIKMKRDLSEKTAVN